MNGSRFQKLKAMLEQVNALDLTSPAQGVLEKRASGRPSGPTLDVRYANIEALEAKSALESLDAVRKGRAVDAEKQFVLEAIVMPLYRPVIDVLDDYIVTDQLTDNWKELGTESRRQWTTDRLLAVGRVNVPGILYAGTGFIVGPTLLMTNRHVALFFAQGLGKQVIFQPGQKAMVNFYHENRGTRSESLEVKKVVMIHPWWDMALLEVKGIPDNRKPLTLSTADPTTLEGRKVVVVGYPGYDPEGDQEFQQVQSRIFRGVYYVKRFQPGVFRGRATVASYGNDVNAVTHDCSTLGGNSGAAVIDIETGHVVGLHFAGTYLVANYAVSPFDLAQDSRVVDAGVNFGGPVSSKGDVYKPIWDKTFSGAGPEAAEKGAIMQSIPPSISPAVAPTSGATASVTVSAGIATMIVPLQLSISLSVPVATSSPVQGALSATASTAPGITCAVPTERLFAPPSPLVDPSRFSLVALNAAAFDWQVALSLALASKIAYEEGAGVKNIAQRIWNFAQCQIIAIDDTYCFVAFSADTVLVSFRGTVNLSNWLSNLNALGTTRDYGVVHRGFLAAFQVVDAQLRIALEGLGTRRLLLTGHSLGGALATIAAAEWQGVLPISCVYTYGQPAVGAGDFPAFMAQHYADKFYRFVNNNDIVPRVPPGYRHIGQLFRFDFSGNLENTLEAVALAVINEAVPIFDSPARPPMMTETEFDLLRAQLLQQRVQARASGLESVSAPTLEGLIPSVSDHAIDRYIAKIATKAP